MISDQMITNRINNDKIFTISMIFKLQTLRGPADPLPGPWSLDLGALTLGLSWDDLSRIWVHFFAILMHYGVMLGLSWVDLRATWVNLGAILSWAHLGMVGHSWAHLGLVGPIWVWLGMVGHRWAHSGLFGLGWA